MITITIAASLEPHTCSIIGPAIRLPTLHGMEGHAEGHANCLCRYLLIKVFPDLSLQRFFDCYFWLIGSMAVIGNVVPPLRLAVRLLAVAGCKHCCRWLYRVIKCTHMPFAQKES